MPDFVSQYIHPIITGLIAFGAIPLVKYMIATSKWRGVIESKVDSLQKEDDRLLDAVKDLTRAVERSAADSTHQHNDLRTEIKHDFERVWQRLGKIEDKLSDVSERVTYIEGKVNGKPRPRSSSK